ncbi:hypothetical protein LRP88_01720 [Fusarium phalaenopsidis]
MGAFKRLVRFAQGDATYFGELLEAADNLLCPLASTPIIICIGLNYKTHAEEAKLTVPKYPAVFTKPADALTGPTDNIPVHPDARPMLDFEGELGVVIGKDAKNVTDAAALDFVLGYTASNDVSARNFQLPEVSGGQFCYAKSFDGFAPIGHAIVHPSELPDPIASRITTKVNGEIKQDSNTDDMIFGVRQIISHLSRGTTLRKGTVIMTGTPSGVGYFRKEFLNSGDVVEVEIEGVGKVQNVILHSD